MIDATKLEVGDIALTLESFDAASQKQSTLRTDKITISVVEVVAPKLSEALKAKILTRGEAVAWSLPAVVQGTYSVVEIQLESSFGDSSFTFDARSNTIEFSGSTSEQDSKYGFLEIIIIDEKGNKTSFI